MRVTDRLLTHLRQCLTSVEVLSTTGDWKLEAQAPAGTRQPWRTVRSTYEPELSSFLRLAQRMGGACAWELQTTLTIDLPLKQVCRYASTHAHTQIYTDAHAHNMCSIQLGARASQCNNVHTNMLRRYRHSLRHRVLLDRIVR